MLNIRTAAILVFAVASVNKALAARLTVTSPNGEIVVEFDLKALPQPHLPGNRPYYRVLYKHATLLADSPLGLTFANLPDFAEDLEIIGTASDEHSSTWEDRLGTRRIVPDQYRE